MRIAHYILIASVILGVVGFSTAVLLDRRQLGMEIFLVGFFTGAAAAVFIALASASSDFGKLGVAIKIAAGGFGLIVFGQLVGFFLDKDGSIGNVFFFIGIVVMMIGIVVAALRIAK